MIEAKTAAEIGDRNFSHWSGQPITPNRHTPHYVPQTLWDGWEVYCSCGEYRAFIGLDASTREETLGRLKAGHAAHVVKAGD